MRGGPTMMVLRQAMGILLVGAVQPTETFMHLMPDRKVDKHPWSRRVRTVGMLSYLGQMLEITESQWKLVTVSKKGQSGLYQLQRRNLFEMPPAHAQQVHQKGNEAHR